MTAEPGPDPRARVLSDIVGVRAHPTVVRLDDAAGESAGWIEESYHLTGEIRNHLDALRKLLARGAGAGVFLVGQYGSGKSHFLAYLARRLRAAESGKGGADVIAISLLNFRSELRLEDIVARAARLDAAEPDRRRAWAALAERYPSGIVLLLDEVSEFLKSKPDARAFNEDVRFLQFLGEWAQDRRFWIVAAMQEQIEHVGDLEYGLYQKIKDRYPLRFLLTAAHVQELVRDAVLVKKPGYDEAAAAVVQRLCEALPQCEPQAALFRSLYPVHPAALALMEEIRDRFSQARGVVDFVVARLSGDPARHAPRLLDEPVGAFLGPEGIVDHFRDQLELQSEFQPLAQRVLPWFREHAAEIFPQQPARELAARILKLLVLVHLSPAREALRADEAAGWLAYRAFRLDPDRNVAVVRKVLETFADRGRFVARSGPDAFRMALEEDGGQEFERRLQREMKDIADRGATLFEWVAPLLSEDRFNPLSLPRDVWQARAHRWHFHDRPYGVFLGNDAPPPRDGPGLVIRLPWGAPEPDPAQTTVLPAPIESSPGLVELAALERLRAHDWGETARRRLDARRTERLEAFRAQVRQAYSECRLVARGGDLLPPPRLQPSTTLDAWLGASVEAVLRRTYPTFDRHAPAHGPLPAEAYRSLMRFLGERGADEAGADEAVQLVREAYLVPMGLVQRVGRDYALSPHLEKNELVRLVMPLIEHQPAPKTLYAHLGGAGHGLVPDQVSLLLIVLMTAGEIDIVKGKQSYRDLFETLPNPVNYDHVVAGTALGLEELRDLQILCDGLGIKTPKSWTVLAQRQAIRRLKEHARRERDRWQPLVLKLRDLGQAPELVTRLRKLVDTWAALDSGEHELQGFQQFRYDAGSVGAFLAQNAELADLPARLDQLLRETGRFRHLLGHPRVASAKEASLGIRIEALGPPPALDSPDAAEDWLRGAAALHSEWKAAYREQHDAYWRERRELPALAWRAPAIAKSRHLDAGAALAELEKAQADARRLQCRSLSDLDYQPLCLCGFDGEVPAFEIAASRAGELSAAIAGSTERFFARPDVRARLQAWVKDGIEVNPKLLAYLEGKAPVPEVANLDLFDRHVAGLSLVQEVDEAEVLALLRERTWTPRELGAAFAQWIDRRGAPRLRFRAGGDAARGEAVARWCLEQALRQGVALPEGLASEATRRAAAALRPDWVSHAALAKLDDLALSGEILDRIVLWILEAKVATPGDGALSPSAAAAREVVIPGAPSTPSALGGLAATLYGGHERMQRLAGARWLERLEGLAATALPGRIAPLEAALTDHLEAQWVLVDALGWALMPALGPMLGRLVGRASAPSESAAFVSPMTTTDSCYSGLAAARIEHPFEKVDAVDALLHEALMPFDDLVRRARAELEIAARKLANRLDPSRPVLLFADHGFRLSPDGRAWQHGGSSTLERLVPLVRFE